MVRLWGQQAPALRRDNTRKENNGRFFVRHLRLIKEPHRLSRGKYSKRVWTFKRLKGIILMRENNENEKVGKKRENERRKPGV